VKKTYEEMGKAVS